MEFKIKNVSVLFVDCEGYDGEIVRSFPFDLLHPTIIVYESKHLIQNDRGHTELILNQLGYNCIHLNDWDKNICAISHEFMSYDEVGFLNTLLS